MCPDRSLLSAFFDGELDQVWKDRILAHLETCESCRAVVEGYRSLGDTLKAEGDGIRSARMEEIFNVVTSSRGQRARVWSRRITLPAPIALAAAALFMLLGGAFVSIAINTGNRFAPMYEISSSGSHRSYAAGELTPFDDFFLAEEDSDLVISLPELPAYSIAGEPRFLLATEYRRRR